MATPTKEQYQRVFKAFESAKKAGQDDKALNFLKMIRQMEQGEPAFSDDPAPAVGERNIAIEDRLNENSFGENLGISAGKSLGDMGDAVKDGYYRLTGDDDSLSKLNKSVETGDTDWAEMTRQKPWMGVAKTGTDIAAGTAVAGGALFGLGRAGITGYKAVAAEGALVEGIFNRGDASERLKRAGYGAGFNIAGQGAMDAGSAWLRSKQIKKDVDGIGEELAIPEWQAQDQIDLAQLDGGYTLDWPDALDNKAAIRERNDIIKLQDSTQLKGVKDQQELDITTRAQRLVDETGGNGLDDISTGEGLSKTLNDTREREKGAFQELFNKLNEARGGQPLDTGGLSDLIDPILKKGNKSAESTVNNVRKVLLEFGVLKDVNTVNTLAVKGTETGWDGGLKKYQSDTPATSVDTPMPVEDPLTIGNYNEMIKRLNDLFVPKSNLKNKGENRSIGQVKKVLDDWIDGALVSQNVSPELVTLGREARSARRAFSDKWEQGDAVEKMTTKNVGVEDFRMKPAQAVKHLTAHNNIEDLRRLKGKLTLSNAADKKVWSDMQQAPLLKAMQKATNSKDNKFDHGEFEKEWKKLTKQAKEVLYDPKYLEKVDYAIAAWNKRGKSSGGVGPETKRSGQARTLVGMTGAAFLSSGRGVRASFAAIPPVADFIKGRRMRLQVTDGEALASGGRTPKLIKSMEDEIKDGLREHYKGTDLLKYDRAIAVLARDIARDVGDGLLADYE